MNKLSITFLLLAVFAVTNYGQQTVFNVPTADVLGQGKVYAEIDAAFKIDRTQSFGRFSSFVPRVVVGVGGNFEVGLNVTGNIQPGSDSTTLVPTVKWKFYKNKKNDVALFGGTHIFIPVRNRSYNIGSYHYLAAAKTFNKTRVTAGAYVATKNVFASNASRAGGQFAIEHTVNDKFAVAADWYTGRNAVGYFTPGVTYKPKPNVTTYFSYSIGNDKAIKGNHFFLFEIGYNFN